MLFQSATVIKSDHFMGLGDTPIPCFEKPDQSFSWVSLMHILHINPKKCNVKITNPLQKKLNYNKDPTTILQSPAPNLEMIQ